MGFVEGCWVESGDTGPLRGLLSVFLGGCWALWCSGCGGWVLCENF